MTFKSSSSPGRLFVRQIPSLHGGSLAGWLGLFGPSVTTGTAEVETASPVCCSGATQKFSLARVSLGTNSSQLPLPAAATGTPASGQCRGALVTTQVPGTQTSPRTCWLCPELQRQNGSGGKGEGIQNEGDGRDGNPAAGKHSPPSVSRYAQKFSICSHAIPAECPSGRGTTRGTRAPSGET